ncbi:hypothetical protein J6590_106287 [Homalodisca vitripennis]|nr:hypothetical protein J6590_106287 [Homalodisca vitripennis]
MDTPPEKTARVTRSVKRKRFEDFNLDDSDIDDYLRDDDGEESLLNPESDYYNFDDLFGDDSDVDPPYVPSEGSDDDDDDEHELVAVPSTSTTREVAKKKSKTDSRKKILPKKQKKDVQPGLPWTIQVFAPETSTLVQPAYLPIDSTDWDAEKYVQQYYDDEILSIIVEKSNQNYLLKTGKELKLKLSELKVWLGINFVMSALQLPKIRMYWEKMWRVPLVADAMTRDRFF